MSAPSPEPKNGRVVMDSLDSVLIVIDKPGDTTRRPRPPNIPRDWPPEEPPPKPPAEPSVPPSSP